MITDSSSVVNLVGITLLWEKTYCCVCCVLPVHLLLCCLKHGAVNTGAEVLWHCDQPKVCLFFWQIIQWGRNRRELFTEALMIPYHPWPSLLPCSGLSKLTLTNTLTQKKYCQLSPHQPVKHVFYMLHKLGPIVPVNDIIQVYPTTLQTIHNLVN